MYQKQYQIDIVGATPLLLHHDNITWASEMKAWASDPANREKSAAGDDRTPAHRWIGCLYSDNDLCVVPADNLMTVLREGGARCPTGKKGGTFKRQTQSGIVVDQAAWPLLVLGKPVPFAGFREACKADLSFVEHEALARAHGFMLFVKRAKVGTSKHIRVRPRFDNWALSGTVTVLDETITSDVLENIVSYAGRYAGLGDWRPSSKQSPGPWGKFTATIKQLD